MSEKPVTAPATGLAPQPQQKARKQVTKRLSTGQKIALSTQDERTLRRVYDHLAGYAVRRSIETALETKKSEVNQLHSKLPPSARLQLQMQPRSMHSPVKESVVSPEDAAQKSEHDHLLDQYYKAKDQLHKLEEKLKQHSSVDHKISFKDLEAVLKSLGSSFSRKPIEQMIWEVDENLDGFIDFDELQLTYYRNITDTTGNEPCYFYKILQFLIFDASNKGYIIEDDCMEILYARYGGGNLEREMKLLFGSKLRAEGGDGTLNLEAYLESVLNRIGRRALLF